MAADGGMAAEGVAAEVRGVNWVAPVSPDVEGVTPDEAFRSYSSSSINLQVHGQF